MSDERRPIGAVPAHVHTPDEVAWPDIEPSEPATMGHLATMNDRITTLSGRVTDLRLENDALKQTLAVMVLVVVVYAIVASVTRRNRHDA